jgi:hypothetical protein
MLPKVNLFLVLCVVLSSVSGGTSSAAPASDNACVVVPDALREIDGLKPGDSRDQLERSFELDGGLQSPSKSTYVFKRYRYIKVDIEFSLGGPGDRPAFLPADRIVKISRLYLEHPVFD